MSNRSDLRRWLERMPRPVTIRAYTADGEELAVAISNMRTKFRDAEQALSASVRCEALDKDGAVLRVWGADIVSAEDSRAPQGELAALARIIAEASDKAAQRHAEAYRLAYEQQSLLVTIMSQRLAGLEKAWHQLLMSIPEGDATDKTNEGMVAQLLGAHLMNQSQQPAPSKGKKTNGGA